MRIDAILAGRIILFLLQPGVERFAAGAGDLAGGRYTLGQQEGHEWIMRAPAQQFPCPEPEPREARSVFPSRQTWQGERSICALNPGLSDHGADRHAEPEFQVVGDKALPGPKIFRQRSGGVWLVHPPSKDVGPPSQKHLVGIRTSDPKAEAAIPGDEVAQSFEHADSRG